MIRDEQRDDDDDDYTIIDGRKVLKDGRGVRVPIQMMDSTQRSVVLNRYMDAGRGHRPGFILDADADDANDDVEDAHAEYCAWLRGAHRAPVADVDYDEPPSRPTSLRDARAVADEAYEARSEWLRNAHKTSRENLFTMNKSPRPNGGHR